MVEWLKALFVLVSMLLLVPVDALAQDENGSALGLIEQLVIVVIPVVTGVVLQLVKRAVSKIPNEYLPILAPIVGMLTQVVASAFDVNLTPGLQGTEAALAAGALGMTAVGGHQIKQQFVRRR